MLYQFRELQRATWLPLNLLAEATRATFRNPRLAAACAPLSGPIVAGAEVAERFTRHFGKPAWRLPVTGIDGDAVTVRETVVARKPFCTLIHFDRDTDREDPVVLVVAPLSGHHATLLRGTVEALLPDHDVYVTDWLDASRVPLARGRFDLDDYIAYVVEFLRLLGPEVHVLAVCQPVVPVLAAVSLMAQDDDPRQPRSMVLMGGPVDASTPATRVTELAMSRPLDWFERTVIQTVPAHLPGAGRRVYPGFLQLAGFMSMNPDRHIDAHVTLFQDLARGDDDGAERHRKFYDEYLSVLDLPAEFYLQTIRQVFQEHALARGTLRWRGEPVNPAAIRRTALMTVEGEKDDICAPGQTRAAHRLCTGLHAAMRAHHLQPGVGHYGLFDGRRWREEILPGLRRFLRSHAGGAAREARRSGSGTPIERLAIPVS